MASYTAEQGVIEDADKRGGSHGGITTAEQGVNEDAVKGGGTHK
jgi:hypothetical protein